LEQGSDCVSNGIVKFAFVMGLAGEEVIAVLAGRERRFHKCILF
jgi:hypothetical protein